MKKWSTPQMMPRLIVEAGAVTEVGRIFCVATYAAETDDPAVFAVYRPFDDLDDFVRREVYFDNDGLTRKRCREAAELLQPRWEEMNAEIDASNVTIEDISVDIDTLEIELEEFDNAMEVEEEESEKEEERPLGRGHRERVRNRIYDNDDNDDDDDDDDAGDDDLSETRAQQRQDIVDHLNERRGDLADEKEYLDELESKLLAFKEEHGGMVTEEEFWEYAAECVKGSIDKYKKLFADDDDLKRIQRAFRACKLFDILLMKDTDVTTENSLTTF